MKRIAASPVLPAALALAACVTTQQAEKAMDSKYVGQPSDKFFAENGPPRTSFKLDNGGTVYTWRGGETTITVPAETKTVEATPGASTTTEKSTTRESHPDDNTTVTETTSTSFSVGTPGTSTTTVTKPEQKIPVYCEAQITANAKGVITSIKATGDTRSVGLVGSRCAEIFGHE